MVNIINISTRYGPLILFSIWLEQYVYIVCMHVYKWTGESFKAPSRHHRHHHHLHAVHYIIIITIIYLLFFSLLYYYSFFFFYKHRIKDKNDTHHYYNIILQTRISARTIELYDDVHLPVYNKPQRLRILFLILIFLDNDSLPRPRRRCRVSRPPKSAVTILLSPGSVRLSRPETTHAHAYYIYIYM